MKLTTGVMGTHDLVPYERNSKMHRDADINAIAASIERFGFNDPIGITPEGIIVEGHGRWMAAQVLNLDQVPVLIIEGLEEKDYDLYRIAHNKIAQTSTFDFGVLFNVLQDLINDPENDMSYQDMGFSDAIMDNLHSHFASPEGRAEAAARGLGIDGSPLSYEIIWDTKEDKEAFAAFLAAEVATGSDKAASAENLMAVIRECAPDLYADAEQVYPGELSLDHIAGTEEVHAHVG